MTDNEEDSIEKTKYLFNITECTRECNLQKCLILRNLEKRKVSEIRNEVRTTIANKSY